MTTPPRRPSPASRATRRSRRPAPRSATFLERYRTRLLWIAGAIVFLLLAGIAFYQGTQPAYACTNLFAPTPAPTWIASPTLAPGESGAPPETEPPPGFVQPDMGHQHTPSIGDRVRYLNCPPASGRHDESPGGPIEGGLYGSNDTTVPQGWVHNLEHGAIVLLYKCPGPGCTDEGQADLGTLLTKWPPSPICNVPPGRLTPVITRFDDMVSPYTAVVWDVVLPMETLDEALLFKFYAAHGERFNPEKQCAPPTPTPGPTPTAGPTGTVAPSVAPSAAPSASAAPATTTAPAAS